MRSVLGLALTMAVLGLGACGGVDEAMLEDPAYQLGYNDGCAGAHQGSAFGKSTRNKAYSGKSKAYDAGWANGFGACGGNPNSARRGDVFEEDSHTGRSQ
jgi:hypothetical protein